MGGLDTSFWLMIDCFLFLLAWLPLPPFMWGEICVGI